MAFRRLSLCFLIAAFIIINAGWQPAIAQIPGLAKTAPSQPAAPGGGTMRLPLITKDFAISQINGTDQRLPAVAYNSKHDEYLVAWQSNYPPRRIEAARVSSQGHVFSAFTVSQSTNESAQAAIAYDPTLDRYLVVYIVQTATSWDVYGRFIAWNSPDATNPNEFAIINWTSDQWNPKVAYNPVSQEFMVTWGNAPSPGVPYISARRVKADGSGFPDTAFAVNSGAEPRINPDIAYNRFLNNYLIVWEKDAPGGDIWGKRLDASGGILTTTGALPTGEYAIAAWPDSEERPSVAACALTGQYIVAWQSNTTDMDYNVYTWPLDTDGTTIGSPLLIDGTADPEKAPEVTCDSSGSNFWIAIQGGHAGTIYRVIGTRIDKNQVVGLSWPSYALSSYSSTLDVASPAIASAGNNVLTVWEQEETSGSANHDIFGSLFYPSPLFIPFVSP